MRKGRDVESILRLRRKAFELPQGYILKPKRMGKKGLKCMKLSCGLHCFSDNLLLSFPARSLCTSHSDLLAVPLTHEPCL